MGDDFDPGAFAPDFELVNGRGAEGVGRGDEHFAAALLVIVGHFADAGGLAGAVDADDHDDGEQARFVNAQGLVGAEHLDHFLLEDEVGVAAGFDAFLFDAAASFFY